MVGRSVQRLNQSLNAGWTILAPTSAELDLCSRNAVQDFFKAHNDIDLVIHCAAKVGGIKANIADPTGFLSDNLLMNTHIIEEARLAGVQKLIYLGSSCMYPKDHKNPLIEDYILEAPLEPTNEGYALAKISGAKHCEYVARQYGLAYRTLIPCNLYGQDDHFDPEKGHLIAAVILKVHEAIQNGEKEIEIWGDGTARREFMYVDDLASFIITCADNLQGLPQYLNTGLDHDYSVNEYYEAVSKILGFTGTFKHNLDMPVGMMRKLMGSAIAKEYGWAPQTSLEDGIALAYKGFLEQQKAAA